MTLIYSLSHIPQQARLLNSPCLVAVGLLVGYEKWLLGWHWHFVIGWFKYRSGLPKTQSIGISCHWWEFPLFFRGRWQSPYTALMAGKCLPLGLCKETVKASPSWPMHTTMMVAEHEEKYTHFNLVVTSGTEGCHTNNLLYCQWQQIWHYDNLWISVTVPQHRKNIHIWNQAGFIFQFWYIVI